MAVDRFDTRVLAAAGGLSPRSRVSSSASPAGSPTNWRRPISTGFWPNSRAARSVFRRFANGSGGGVPWGQPKVASEVEKRSGGLLSHQWHLHGSFII
jgi:hypothetical protein